MNGSLVEVESESDFRTVLVTSPGPDPGVGRIARRLLAGRNRSAEPGCLLEVGLDGRSKPTLLKSRSASELATRIEATSPGVRAVAKGRDCWVSLSPESDLPDRIREVLGMVEDLGAVFLAVAPSCYLEVRGLLDPESTEVLIKGTAETDPVVQLALDEAADAGYSARSVIPGKGKLERIRPVWRSESGQAAPLVLGAALMTITVAVALVAIAGAGTGKGRAQRAADLAALSAARSMRDDLPRLLAPATLPNGLPNPAHLPKPVYLARARLAGISVAVANGGSPATVSVVFPDAASFAPLTGRVSLPVGGPQGPAGTAWAVARIGLVGSGSKDLAFATGGGYSGPLAIRQGHGMRPDVAGAFDRMAAAALRDGVGLAINSGYRSDAEQARLFAANPDPRWVAPPGQSLHRCGTELDIGPPSAYGWLAANAGRFGFLKRYSWEPWHFGFVAGPEPCSAAAEVAGVGEGARGSTILVPDFVPIRFRRPILAASLATGVPAALLAAQLKSESNFDPNAVSPAGALGIAQFMPSTAASRGLRDPFDPFASIAAQARLMAELIAQFDSARLALAAYNAGPGAVSACGCVPSYPETLAYVARVLALAGGAAGSIGVPMEVELVR
ncbi:MAG: transglycosylase SLT domain-containing protein [Solirubrobacterales bacterium]